MSRFTRSMIATALTIAVAGPVAAEVKTLGVFTGSKTSVKITPAGCPNDSEKNLSTTIGFGDMDFLLGDGVDQIRVSMPFAGCWSMSGFSFGEEATLTGTYIERKVGQDLTMALTAHSFYDQIVDEINEYLLSESKCDYSLLAGDIDPLDFIVKKGNGKLSKNGDRVKVDIKVDGEYTNDSGKTKNVKAKIHGKMDFEPGLVNPGFDCDEIIFDLAGLEILKQWTSIENPGGGDGGDTVTEVGDVINYEVDVTNRGNQQLTNVQINDSNVTLSCNGGLFNGVLDAGETVTCTGSDTVGAVEFAAACDVDTGTGVIVNTATATSNETGASVAVEIVDLECFEAPALPADEMTIDKTATSPQPVSVDDVIDYEIVVQSNSAVLLTGVVVTDTLLNNIDCGAFNGTLSLFETVTCTGSHTVSAADVEFACGERDETIRNIAEVNSNESGAFFADELVDVVCP